MPDEIAERWSQFREKLLLLSEVRIRTWIETLSNNNDWTIHALCVASLTSYAACVYVRVKDREERIHVQLVAAMSKVVPLK